MKPEPPKIVTTLFATGGDSGMILEVIPGVTPASF